MTSIRTPILCASAIITLSLYLFMVHLIQTPGAALMRDLFDEKTVSIIKTSVDLPKPEKNIERPTIPKRPNLTTLPSIPEWTENSSNTSLQAYEGLSERIELNVNFSPDGVRMSNLLTDTNRPAVRQVTLYPEYPIEARLKGVQGHVIVAYTVTARGDIQDIEILESPSPLLTKSVLRTLSRWKFQPSIKDGKAISVRLKEAIDFTLEK